MAKPQKRKIEGGRVTPKGGPTATPSARYTPPVARKQDLPSPMWVPVLMFALLGLGVLVIVLNYVSLLPGGEVNNWYLVLGLVLILGGIITATQFR
jgi:uncharacterized membrane protein